MRGKLIEPTTEEVLEYCARDPVERVFLEDVARRGHGRFVAVQVDDELSALCHLGTNAVPSGEACGVFADHVVRAGTRILLVPACAAAHLEELGVDPLDRDPEGFRWRTRAQIEERRSWVWEDEGVILFKAEASAWTPRAVQLQQVWTDPPARGRGYATRALRDLVRLLLTNVPVVCLFVRTDNDRAIQLYERIGMRRVLFYRSVLL